MDQVNIILFGIAGLVITLLLTLAFFLVFYSGLLYNVVVRAGTPPVQGFMVAYKFLVGPYKDVGYTFTEAISIDPKLKSFGVYYDDPKVVGVFIIM